MGYVRTWGSNTDGQLGHFSGKPSLVEIRGVMRQLSCGGAHTAALTDDGQLYVWGRCNEGQARSAALSTRRMGDHSSGRCSPNTTH